MNPGKKFDRAGETILVANVLNRPAKLTIGRIEVDKSRQTVKAFDASGALIAFFPATVGSEEKPTPNGTLKVVSADANPNYRYNPDYKFKGVKSKEAFTIKPGPNNPVGSYWIGLSAEGYGIHGTPNPSKVSKAESHGCVRLTNWDAGLLGSNVKKGTPVVFVDEPQGGTKELTSHRPRRLHAVARGQRAGEGASLIPPALSFKIISIALAKPSSSFDAVTCVAGFLTSSVALPIAIERPLFPNIARSFCHVADGGDRVGRNAEALGHRLARRCPCRSPAG